MIEYLGLFPEEIKQNMEQMGEKAFRAKQVFSWLHKGASFDEMTNLSVSLREKLKENGVDLADVKIGDCFSTADPVLMMLQDSEIQAYGATLYSAPSGVLIGEQILKALNGEPMNSFTAYDLLITEPENAQEIKDSVFPDA